MNYNNYIDVKEDVLEALKSGRPVVALESTIISHGMPYPENVFTAKNTEEIIKSMGVVPATIAIIKGRIKVGLTPEDLEYLGSATDVVKVSRRDFPYVIAKKMNGATTVAATMIIAELAGIKVFVTGGIGGVHRGAEKTFDISADLTELSKTNVAVVCAGAKSILDIGLTLEYLETQGVPVIGYETDEFPAFYTRKSGYKVEMRIDNPTDMAMMMHAKWDLGINGGIVIGNPIPTEFSMDDEYINKIIDKLVIEAEKQNIKGKEVTPFLLSKIKDKTTGNSLKSNIELVYNNARVGSLIAIEYSKLKNNDDLQIFNNI